MSQATTPASPEADSLWVPFKLPDKPQRLRILSLTGGGYRGLYTARVLMRLEQRFGSLHEKFDVFAGTSIGGLLASGLAVGIPAARLYDTFKSHGARIFPGRFKRLRAVRKAFMPAFATAPLDAAIQDCLGDHARQSICAVEKPLVVTSVDWASGSAKLFRSGGFGLNFASSETLLDVCLATSAAPTYFKAHRLNGAPFLDGGLVANNPDMIALVETMRRWPDAMPNIEVLSVGTAGVGSGGMAGKVPCLLTTWATQLPHLFIAVQERLAIEHMMLLLGDRYLRLNHIPDKGQGAFSEMTTVDASMTATLEVAADRTFESAVAHRLASLAHLLN